MLKDKTVIVTGGAKGIGKAIALAFANEGCNIVLNYRSTSPEEVKAEIEAKLSGHLPQYRRLYGKDHCGCPPMRLRFHPVRPPPRPAGAEQQQPQHPGQRRTDGPQHPYSGHGC